MFQWADHFLLPWLHKMHQQGRPATYSWRMENQEGLPFLGQEWLYNLQNYPVLLQGQDALLIAKNFVFYLLDHPSAPFIPCYLPATMHFGSESPELTNGGLYDSLEKQLNTGNFDPSLSYLCTNSYKPLLFLVEVSGELLRKSLQDAVDPTQKIPLWIQQLQILLYHSKVPHKLILLDPDSQYRVDAFAPLEPIQIKIKSFDAQVVVPLILEPYSDWMQSWLQHADRIQNVTAVQLNHLKKALAEQPGSIPNRLALWQALLAGKLNLYQTYVSSLRQFINSQWHRPKFLASVSNLEDYFVEVYLEEKPKEEKQKSIKKEDSMPPAESPAVIQIQASGLPEFLKKQDKPFVVQGGAGTGKSMLLRHITLELAYENANLLPVYLNLRNLEQVDLRRESWEQSIWQHLRQISNDEYDWVKDYLLYFGIKLNEVENNPEILVNRLYFVLDAFDEVSQNEADIENWIVKTLTHFRSRMIISSRIENSFLFEGTQHNWVIAFEAPQQKSLISKYHPPNSEAYQKILDLTQDHQTLQLPLLLALLCIFWEGERLPGRVLQTQGGLLKYFVECMLKVWLDAKNEEMQGHYKSLVEQLTARAKGAIDEMTVEQELHILLAYLAFRMHCSHLDLTQERLNQWWEDLKLLQNRYSKAPKEKLEIVNLKLPEKATYSVLRILSALMVEVPGKSGAYRFPHQSFQEFLTAEFLNTWMEYDDISWFISTKGLQLKSYPFQKTKWVFNPPKPVAWRWDSICSVYALNEDEIQALKNSPNLRCLPDDLPLTIPIQPIMNIFDPNWKQVLMYLAGFEPQIISDVAKGKFNRLSLVFANAPVDGSDYNLRTDIPGRYDYIIPDVDLAVYLTREVVENDSKFFHALNQLRHTLKIYGCFQQHKMIRIFGEQKVFWAADELSKGIYPRKQVSKLEEKHYKLDGLTRREIVIALGKIGSDKALPALINALKDPYVYQDAIKALSTYKNNQAILALLSNLKYKTEGILEFISGKVRSKKNTNIYDALLIMKANELADVLIKEFPAQNQNVRRELIMTLSQYDQEVGDADTYFTRNSIFNHNEDEMKKVNYCWRLQREKLIDLLLLALKDSNKRVRAGAALSLHRMIRYPIPSKVHDDLISAIQDLEPVVWVKALQILQRREICLNSNSAHLYLTLLKGYRLTVIEVLFRFKHVIYLLSLAFARLFSFLCIYILALPLLLIFSVFSFFKHDSVSDFLSDELYPFKEMVKILSSYMNEIRCQFLDKRHFAAQSLLEMGSEEALLILQEFKNDKNNAIGKIALIASSKKGYRNHD